MEEAITAQMGADGALVMAEAPPRTGESTRGESTRGHRSSFGSRVRSSFVAVSAAIANARQIWCIDDPAPSLAEFVFTLRRVWEETQNSDLNLE